MWDTHNKNATLNEANCSHQITTTAKNRHTFVCYFSAERVGFEPTVTFATPVFKTGSFDHSDTSPKLTISLWLVVIRNIITIYY